MTESDDCIYGRHDDCWDWDCTCWCHADEDEDDEI